MKQSLIWRGILIFGLVTLAGFSAWPPGEKVRLGLDLRGGTYLVLEVVTEDALRAERDKATDRLLQELRGQGIEAQASETGETSFEVTGTTAPQQSQVQSIADEFLPAWSVARSGDLVRVRLRAEEENLIRDQAVNQALQTIRNRVDAFGVTEPVIQRQGLGGNRLVVQLPGVDDPERVKDLIKNTAFLEFRLVDYPNPQDPVASSREEILAHYGGALPSNVEVVSQDLRDELGQLQAQYFFGLEKRAVITGRDLKDARPSLGEFNQPVVSFSLTPDGAKIFGETTGNNVGRGLAIVLDGKVQSAPRINSRITDSGVIEGGFAQQEVEDLSTVLRSGALPAGINYLEERSVGPTLGQDSIDQGARAGLIGLALVVLAMLMVYKSTGFNAVVALAMNVVLVFGMLAYFGATLTLPGIAGIILTVGMAVDANVLVFERIREELRSGRTVKAAVAAGFNKALSSVLDANITTLIAAAFLFNFGTGPIRGFAVTLSVGILASVFTALVNSRWMFDLWLQRPGRVEQLSI